MSTYSNTTEENDAASKKIVIARAPRIDSKEWRSDETTWGAFAARLSVPYEHGEFVRQQADKLPQSNGREYLKQQTPPFFGGGLNGGSKTTEEVLSRDVLAVDFDNGQHNREDIKARLAGLEFVIYATVSHLATATDIDCNAYVKFAGSEFTWDETEWDNGRGTKRGVARSDVVARYLMEEKAYPREIVANLIENIEAVELVRNRRRFETLLDVSHSPVARLRAVVQLANSFVVADHGGHSSASKAWKAACLAFFEKRGLKVDASCAELARGFYVPATTWEGNDPNVEHVLGQPLDFDAIIAELPEVEPKTSKSNAQAAGLPNDYEAVLGAICADEREVWLKVGMGIHAATDGSDEGFEIWHGWALEAAKNDRGDDEKTWRNFKTDREGRVSWASVEWMARQGGWSRNEIQWPEVNRTGVPAPTSIANAEAVLRHFGIHLYYDAFCDKCFIEEVGALDDSRVRRLWADANHLGLKVRKEFFFDVVISLAERDVRHPVRDYLDSVQPTWDGEPRLDKWLVNYAGAEDTEFNRAVGAKFMIAAVHRVRKPGCKFDNMLVLEGGEGTGKSTLSRVLATDAWFSDCLPIDADPKIVIEQTRGRWIIEMAELKDIKSRAVEGVKSFLSRREDSARAVWNKIRGDIPRQFVIIGTTNDSTYLQGTTGNRRFWPVAAGAVDLQALQRDRDQLWAEAAVREAKGESILLPEDLWGVAKEVQENRRVKSPIEEKLEEALDGLQGIFRCEEIYSAIGLGGDGVARRTATHGPLIKAVMDRLGFMSTRIVLHGRKVTVYRRGNSTRTYKWNPEYGTFWNEAPATKVDPIDQFAGPDKAPMDNYLKQKPKLVFAFTDADAVN